MRKLSLPALVAGLWMTACLPAAAQSSSMGSRTFLKHLAQIACDSISAREPDTSSAKNLDQDLSVTIGKVLLYQLAGIRDSLGIDISNGPQAHELGVNLGLELTRICPSYLRYALMIAQQSPADSEAGTAVAPAASSEDYSTVEGRFSDIETGNLAFINFIGTDGTAIRCLWLSYFKGSELLRDHPEELNGKKLRITYKKIVCYIPKAEGYQLINQIAGLAVEP
jgi:hypothetical protein